MVYLLIMFLVAAAGITRLWLVQRRETAHLATVAGFQESLRTLSRHTRTRRPIPGRPLRGPRTVTHIAPLDAKRRAEAKRRLEARRRRYPGRIAS